MMQLLMLTGMSYQEAAIFFENYQLDRTVIRDNDYSVRSTTSYENGDALVKSDPNRFQYVPNQNLLESVDY